MSISRLTNKILESKNILSVLILEEEDVLSGIWNILDIHTNKLKTNGFESTLEKQGTGLIWEVNVPNSNTEKRVLKIINANEDGSVECDDTQEFPAPGIFNLNRSTNLEELLDGVEAFMKDMESKFNSDNKEETKEDEPDTIDDLQQNYDKRPMQEKIAELPPITKTLAKRGLNNAEKLKRDLKSKGTVVATDSQGTREFKIIPDKIVAGTDNNLFLSLKIDGKDLGALKSPIDREFREDLKKDINDKGFITDFVLDRKNDLWFLCFVGKFPALNSSERLKLWGAFEGLVVLGN